MLLDLRETIRNSKPLKYTLIGVICIPFALVGIGSYFTGGGYGSVATVNGEEIGEQELEFAYQQQRQQLAQVFGGQIPEGFGDENLLRQQALEQLVTQRLMVSEVAEQKFAVSDETLGRAIRQRPEFQTDGRFDAERYRQLLGSQGGQVAAFEAQYRDETAIEQFRDGVVDTSFTLLSEAERVDALARQTRTIDALRFDIDAIRETVEIDDAAVQARFDETAETQVFPRRARIEWVELSASGLAESIDVSEDEAQDWYENNRSNYMTPELREASHILITVDDAGEADEVAEARAEIEAIIARIDAGEAFEDLARELSEDSGSAPIGGSLGAISPGLMVAAFEEATYEIEGEGSISGPVETEFGVHVIRVDKVIPEEGQSFEDVRDEAFAGASRDIADRDFFELRVQMEELAFDNPDSLQAVADATGLEVQTSDWLDVDTDSGPVLSHPAVQAAMFSEDVLEEGNNSDPIEVAERHVISLRVAEYEDERPKSLEDVRDELVEILRTERAGEALDEGAQSAIEALAGGADAATFSEGDDNTEALVAELLTRDSTVFDRAAIQEIFAAPAPTDSEPSIGVTELSDGDRLAWKIIDIATPDAVATDEDTGEVTVAIPPPDASAPVAGADPRRGGAEFSALLSSLRERADVDIEL